MLHSQWTAAYKRVRTGKILLLWWHESRGKSALLGRHPVASVARVPVPETQNHEIPALRERNSVLPASSAISYWHPKTSLRVLKCQACQPKVPSAPASATFVGFCLSRVASKI